MSETNNKATFSEEAGEETIKIAQYIIDNNIQETNTVLITAPTGKGKSWFIKNQLYNYCKKHKSKLKILYLLPRAVVRDEFKAELTAEHKDDIITVMLYQDFEKRDVFPSFDVYDIIICDECHYFVSDAMYNSFTYRSYERIFQFANNKLRFFITATPLPIKTILTKTVEQSDAPNTPKHLQHKLWHCNLTGLSVVKDVHFFKIGWDTEKKKNVQYILDEIDNTEPTDESGLFNNTVRGDKAIVFCDSVKYAHDLYKQYEGKSLFICSRHNEKYKNYVNDIDKEAYNKMLTEHKFDCKYIFCTSALDVGFSIKDTQVKHIICMLQDWNSVVQAVGRKRILGGDLNDRITLYLPDYSNQTIGKKIKETLKLFEHCVTLENKGAEVYMEKFEKIPDPSKIVYYKHNGDGTCKLCIDEFVRWYWTHRLALFYNISTIDSPNKYRDWVLKQFNLPSKQRERTLYGIERDLKPFAENGQLFTKKDKDIIVNIIDHKNKKNGRIIKDMKVLEEYLQKIGCRYMIVSGSKRETVDGKDKKTTTYQIIERPQTNDEQKEATEI